MQPVISPAPSRIKSAPIPASDWVNAAMDAMARNTPITMPNIKKPLMILYFLISLLRLLMISFCSLYSRTVCLFASTSTLDLLSSSSK